MTKEILTIVNWGTPDFLTEVIEIYEVSHNTRNDANHFVSPSGVYLCPPKWWM